MELKAKILAVLKTKYSNLGFKQKVLDGLAVCLEKSVTDESQIETVVDGLEEMLKVFQADADRARTEYNMLKGQYDELKAKADKSPANGGGQDHENEPDDDEPAWFKAYKQQQEERYNAIKTESDTLKAAKAKTKRTSLIIAKAKELGILEWCMKEGFVIADDADKKAIGDYLASVQKNLVADWTKQSPLAQAVPTMPNVEGEFIAIDGTPIATVNVNIYVPQTPSSGSTKNPRYPNRKQLAELTRIVFDSLAGYPIDKRWFFDVSDESLISEEGIPYTFSNIKFKKY